MQSEPGDHSPALPPVSKLARPYTAAWPRERTVAVGDTPADVTGAHAAGIRVVAFGSDLDGADEVIERMAELPETLERLSAAT